MQHPHTCSSFLSSQYACDPSGGMLPRARLAAERSVSSSVTEPLSSFVQRPDSDLVRFWLLLINLNLDDECVIRRTIIGSRDTDHQSKITPGVK